MGLVGGNKFQALHLIAFVIPATFDKAGRDHLGAVCRLMQEEGSLRLKVLGVASSSQSFI